MKHKGLYLAVKLKPVWITAVSAGLVIMLFCFREQALQGAVDGLLLCGRVVIPSLFPFMALAGFISRSGSAAFLGRFISPIFRLLFGVGGETATAVLLSFVSGYPVSSKLLAQLCEEGVLKHGQARRLLRFCVNPGPAFVITAVGGIMLASVKAGVLLFMSVMLASVTVGIFSRTKTAADVITVPPERSTSAADAFCEGCASAASSIINICAFTVMFSCISSMLTAFSLPAEAVGLALPVLEITTGLSRVGNIPLPLFAAYISFGGISVLFQVYGRAKTFGTPFSELLLWRTVSAVLAFVFAVVLFWIFPVKLSAVPTVNAVLKTGQGSIFSSVMLVVSLCVFLIYLGQLFFREKIAGK